MTNVGGKWTTQDRKVPGAYINVISSTATTQALSARGIVAFATNADWGKEQEIISLTAQDFQRNARDIFGYSATSPQMKGIADIFKHARQLLFYRLNPKSGGQRAKVTFEPADSSEPELVVATAKTTGIRGNDLAVAIEYNINTPDVPTAENPPLYDVTTFLDGLSVDIQTQISAMDQLKENAFLTWNESMSIMELIAAASGGATAPSTAVDIESALSALESHSYHVFGTDVEIPTAVGDYIVSYVKRMRDDVGMKMQAVIYAPVGVDFKTNHEGIIAVQNGALVDPDTGKTEDGFGRSAPVFWVAGAAAAAAVNESLTGSIYTGAFPIEADYTLDILETFIDNGKFAFYRSGDEIEVLRDINSLTTFTETKNEDFSNNQTIRILDQLAVETALLFNNTYKGAVPNDEIGRISFKSGINSIYEQMQDLRAIQNHSIDNLVVGEGMKRNAVYLDSQVWPVNAMEFLYANIRVI